MRFLGIDYGTKRVGLSISDEGGKLAFPYKILKNDEKLIDLVENICGEENINEIVIGESLDLSGEPNAITRDIKSFADSLKRFGLPIHFEKEFMTSIEARGRGGKERNNERKVKNKRSEAVDSSAAALILQRYLDKKQK